MTRKTENILGWIDFDWAEQCEWAVGFLAREHEKSPLPGNPNLEDLRVAVNQIQAVQSVPAYVGTLNDLDNRMRRAWDEQLRRQDPHTKAYQFRMSKRISQRLAWLRNAWKEPISSIVEALIDEAYLAGKQERAQARARANANKHIQKTSRRLLKLENQQKKSDAQIQALEKLVGDLTLMLCEEQHRLTTGLSPGASLGPEDQRTVSENAKKGAAAYLEQVEAKVNLLPENARLSKASEKDLNMLELLNPKPSENSEN